MLPRSNTITTICSQIQRRSYATIQGVVPKPRVKELLEKPYRDRYNLTLPQRVVYEGEVYDEIISSNRALFVLQVNNTTPAELKRLRKDMKSAGYQMKFLRNSTWKYFCRQNGASQLGSVTFGPSVVIYSNDADDKNPGLIKKMMSIVKQHEKKVFLAGGSLDKSFLTLDTIRRMEALPTLQTLRAQLVGLLEHHQRSVVGVLGQRSQELVLLLGQHENNLKEEQK